MYFLVISEVNIKITWRHGHLFKIYAEKLMQKIVWQHITNGQVTISVSVKDKRARHTIRYLNMSWGSMDNLTFNWPYLLFLVFSPHNNHFLQCHTVSECFIPVKFKCTNFHLSIFDALHVSIMKQKTDNPAAKDFLAVKSLQSLQKFATCNSIHDSLYISILNYEASKMTYSIHFFTL